ncbi:MAG: DedA family protein [Nitrososphaerales archaeon]
MSFLDSIFQFPQTFLEQTGYLGIFFLMFLESATLPVPSEVVLPLAGYLVYQGSIEFWTAVIVASVGSLVGTSVDFAIGYYLGRPAVIRYGKTLRISEKHLLQSERWFAKYGPITVLLARFVPLIRTLVAFPAGIAEMKIPKFLAYSFVGIFLWDAVLIYLGVRVGANVSQITSTLQKYFLPVEVAAVVIVGVVLFMVYKRATTEKELAKEKQSSK